MVLPVSRAISPGCGVRISGCSRLPATFSAQGTSALSASASNTIGRSRCTTIERTKARVVSSDEPSPGPIAKTSRAAAISSARSAASLEMAPIAVSASGSVMHSAMIRAATTGCDDSGVATVTSPAPARMAASPTMQAAPVLPREPAMTSTLPASPLLACGLRRERASHRATTCSSTRFNCEPHASINSSGEPMRPTTSSPLASQAGGRTLAIFGAVNVTVRCARTAGPINSVLSDATPEGTSTATTVKRSRSALMSSMASANNPAAGRASPVPNIASITMSGGFVVAALRNCSMFSISIKRD